MYADLARLVLEEDPVVLRTLERMRARHPGVPREELIRRLIARAAWRGAAAAAAAGAAAELLDRTVSGVDLPFQVVSLNRLAASIAAARQRRTTLAERSLAALGSLLVAGAMGVVRQGAGGAARAVCRRRAPRLAPVLSGLIGAAVGFAAARAFGRAADDFVAGRRRRLWAG